MERRAARFTRRGSVDHLAPSHVNLDEALVRCGEDMLNEPIPPQLLQVLTDRDLEETDRPDQRSQQHCPRAFFFRAPPGVGGLQVAPFHFGLGSRELFSRPVSD